ncbi:hypothetical protein AMK59_991 [Oryctes borbonicus]|uniref:SESTD1-like spectrin repeats region domain-containing protein n=1 Tax=Oryctes borbonicus TaxID=1629725 RepID=A0A0T6BBG5_9SCAR|nr:hypothetical protein AMK59_991 [Oryctes borbonicus]
MFIYNHDLWMENRMKIEEYLEDGASALKNLDDLHQHLMRGRMMRPSEVETTLNNSSDLIDTTKVMSHDTLEKGRLLLEKIESDNRNRKFDSDTDSMLTPQDILDALEQLEAMIGDIRKKQSDVDAAWLMMQRNFLNTKDLSLLEEGIVKVTNWILGPAESLLNSKQKVGYDVASAEELRREHEAIELQCWDTYGAYAELVHKVDSFARDEPLTIQQKDLISQKDFMDFVCRSFATRLERRRNILITSLRFFRLVSEYFDKTGEVFDSLVMGNKIGDFASAGQKLKKLQESQALLDAVERELVKEGEKLSDMLSMPVKDALGRELVVDYTEDIINVRDILDATTARKNIFSDSVELQKLTLEQVTHIHQYETDASQAIQWLDDLFHVLLKDHGHVGVTVYEIQFQKDEHQTFQETAKDTYNYGCQLLNASLALRQSCKLPLDEHANLQQRLKFSWQRLLNVGQEQMTRLRVSAVFHRSIEDHCNQLRDLRETVATIPLMELSKRRAAVKHYFSVRENLMVEVGRMVRLGRLLRSRLKEPLYFTDEMSDVESKDEGDTESSDAEEITGNNATAIEAISERLTEVTSLSEELDQTLKNAQQDCAILTTAATSTTVVTNTVPVSIISSTKHTPETPPSISEVSGCF